MNTSYYADINSILNVFRLSEEEADRIINSFELDDYDEDRYMTCDENEDDIDLDEFEEVNEEEDFFG